MKSPKAKEAVFLNSFGVAIGRAIMMARQSLHYSRHQQSLERSKVVVCSQYIECNVHTLKSGDYRRRKRRNDPVADEHSGEYSTEDGFSFCFSMSGVTQPSCGMRRKYRAYTRVAARVPAIVTTAVDAMRTCGEYDRA